MSSCSYHASKESVAACRNCGKLLCSACNKEIDSKSYCPPCVEKLFAAKPEEKPVAAVPAVKEQPAPVAAAIPDKAPAVEKEPVTTTATVSEPLKQIIKAEALSQPAAALSTAKSELINPLWWIAVFFLGWIGGLIAWFKNKQRFPLLSRYMLYGGIGWSALQVLVAGIFLFTSVIAPAMVNIKISAPEKETTSSTVAGNGQPGKSQTQTGSTQTIGKTSQTSTIVSAPKEETIVVNPPEINPPTPPAPLTYQTTPLATQTVQPSSESQIVSYLDRVSVKIPANTIDEQQKLTISAVSNAPQLSEGEVPLAIYDISFEKQHEFNNDLEFAFSYNAADIPEDKTPASALAVSYWDEETGAWVPMQFSADTSSHTLTVRTYHNGLWIVRPMHGIGQIALITDHFIVFFKTEDFESDKLVCYWKLRKEYEAANKQPNWTPEIRKEYDELRQDPEVINILQQGTYAGTLQAQDQHYYNENPGIPRFVTDVACYAEEAWKKYSDTFQKEPILSNITIRTDAYKTKFTYSGGSYSAGTETVTTDTAYERFPIYIDKAYENPCYYGRSKSMCVGFTVLTAELRGFIAHELFHAVQNKDYYMATRQSGFGQVTNLAGLTSSDNWWFESTADYAAYKTLIGSGPTNHSMDVNYFKENFFSDGNPDENHPYKNAYFIDFLSKQGIPFSQLYTGVAKTYGVRGSLDEYLKENMPGKSGLYESYHEWFQSVLFDENGPLKSAPETRDRPTDTTTQNLTINIGELLTSTYQGINPAVDSEAGKRTLIITLQKVGPEVQPEQAWVDVYRLKNNDRSVSNMELVSTWDIIKDSWPKELGKVDLNEGDALYILVTKYGVGQSTFFINVVDEPSLKLKCPKIPSGELGTMGEAYTYERIDTGIPASATYTWYVDGKSIDKTGKSLTQRFWEVGQHSVQIKASWPLLQSAKSNTCVITTPNPVITLKSPITSGEKALSGTSYTFTQESSHVPSGAQYWWYVNDKEIEGDNNGATHVFEAPGTYKVKVRAEWPVPEGEANGVEDSTTVTIETGFSIVANPYTGNTGQPSQFGITGEGIPENAGFTWEFGKGEGGISTNSKEAKATHIYEKAGTYAVSVNVVNRSTKKSMGKASLEYKVDAQPYVVISPKPATAKPGDKLTFNFRLYNMPSELSMEPRNHWIFARDNVESAWPSKEEVTFTFDKAGTYRVQVVVEATGKDGKWIKSKEGDNWLTDKVMITVEDAPTVEIIPPGDLSKGQGLPEKSYSFGVKPTDIPKDATYTWYLNDKQIAKGEKSKKPSVKTEKEPQDYEVKVVASWKENKKQLEAEATFEFTTLTGITLSNGQFISGSGACALEGLSDVINKYLDQALSKITITITNDKVNADQTVPVTISTDDGSASGNARVIINGTYVKGKLSGTMSVDGMITAKGEDNKSFPIDLKYVGSISASNIPQAPKGESVTCTYTGTISSEALYQLILAIGDAIAACAEEAGGEVTSSPTLPTSPDFCTDYVTLFTYTATVSGK